MTKKEKAWYQGKIYTDSIKKLFESKPVSNFYQDWKRHFTYIHGKLDTQRKIDIQKLESTFEVSLRDSGESLFELIFCLETYYYIILRIIAYKTIFGTSQYNIKIFDDDIYTSRGISNFTCIPCYNWFLNIPNVSEIVSPIYDAVNLKDTKTEGDAISSIFECIFPKEIRHSVGEYYTPYWLANAVIDKITEDDDEAHLRKFIDPACGSATFIVALINKYRRRSQNAIFSNVCGIDINPLTVLAAKTNYLLLYCKEFALSINNPLEIPIYHADTIAINDVSNSLFCESSDYDTVPRIKYDYIVGNPPWVNWEYMPDVYRMNHARLWQYYGLFSQKGLNSNFIKEDISVLLTYVAIDNYLKIGGKIGFIVKETLFKSIKQGEGFRKFKILPKNIGLNVICVDDLTNIKPFRDAVTRTAIVYMEKGKHTTYPVNYIVWIPRSKIKVFDSDRTFCLSDYISFTPLKARPSVKETDNSGWITESEEDKEFSGFILGNNELVARTGVFTGGANGIFWLNIESENGDNVIISNITERAKNKMKKVRMEVEKQYIFPFLTGKELDFWSYSYSKYILCPHTKDTKMYPIDIHNLSKFPLTENYLKLFREELEARKGFTSMDKSIHEQYFYTLQRIGTYTFAKYKVCWRYISKKFTPAVVEYTNDKYLGYKNIIGNEKIISISFENSDEAYYVCAVISSTPYRKTIENYMVGTQITPSIIKRLRIPNFNAQDSKHLELARLCREGHKTADKRGYIEKIDTIINQWLR